MNRAFTLIACLLPLAALAQSAPVQSGGGQGKHPMMMHSHKVDHGRAGRLPTQPGQSAFAAIQEIVGILEADPTTDWSKVNIDALRQHLIDMSNVTLAADVKSKAVQDGVRFDVTGVRSVENSVRRMVRAHAAAMNGVDGWHFETSDIDGGESLTVHGSPKDADKLRGLGFFGIMAQGMHHQEHHLMIARGASPHG